MGATASGEHKEVGTYERVAPGLYPARCIQVVELGTHDVEYNGEKKSRKELMIVWELSEAMQDGRPFVVSWRGTNSLSEKSKLFSMLNSWRGVPFNAEDLRKFELKKILDVCCMVNVSLETAKSGKEYNKVLGVVPMAKGLKCDDRVNDLVDFGIGDIGTDEFAKLWPYVQKIVMESKEAQVPEQAEAFNF